jgi:hypothetical protein
MTPGHFSGGHPRFHPIGRMSETSAHAHRGDEPLFLDEGSSRATVDRQYGTRHKLSDPT